MSQALSRRWRAVFAVEVPICFVTCVVWLVFPGRYLGGLFGKTPYAAADYLLLQQGGSVVFTMFVYFYARLLWSEPVDLRVFRFLQEAMAIGDGLVLVTSWAAHRYLSPDPALLWAQVGMALFWLGVRIVFLARAPR